MRAERGALRILMFSCNEDPRVNEGLHRSFARAAKLHPSQVVMHLVGERAPDASSLVGFDAVFIAGSAYSVFEQVPNQDVLLATVQAARQKRIPILGICYGAQLLAYMDGGEVIRDHAHAEWGTFDVTTTDEALGDALFADMPFTFPVMQAHRDRITKVPPEAIVLASSARCAVQAFTFPGEDIYAMQFHPERNVADYEERLAYRGAAYAGDDATVDEVRATLAETPESESLIAKFIDRIVLARE